MRVDTVSNIPSQHSITADWIIWHKALKTRYGKKQANLVFIAAWQRRNQDGFILSGKANTVEMREYLDSQGVTISGGALSYVADAVDEVEDMIGNVIGTASKAAMGVALVVFLLLIWIVVRIVRNPDQYASLVKTMASRGAVL